MDMGKIRHPLLSLKINPAILVILADDSLLFPSVNWLFHVQMGILAGYSPPTGSAFMADP